MEAGKERLTRDSVWDATRQEVRQLKRDSGELKQLVGELSLEAHRLKKRPYQCLSSPTVSADESAAADAGHGTNGPFAGSLASADRPCPVLLPGFLRGDNGSRIGG